MARMTILPSYRQNQGNQLALNPVYIITIFNQFYTCIKMYTFMEAQVIQ